eukprot:snap_masked-scaffold_65-processed-gene-0.42-mRNA-1 protein AED:0.15 eAED:0.15 QI:81/0.4/0.33/0.66/0.8/0.66/6/0/410
MSFAKNAQIFSMTTIAAILGTSTCSIASYIAQQNPPKSSNNFLDRYKERLIAGDPLTLLHSNSSIETLKAKTDLSETEQRILTASLHPDTQEIVPQPFRMSGYVPYNGPICAAMMLTTSTSGLVFWNWVNQSHNALVNYFNRNATSTTSNSTLITSYLGAVGSAMTVAFTLSKVITNQSLLKFIAFPSSMVASSLNCYIMRRPETQTGINIFDETGKQIGSHKSKAAAKKAVMETVGSRSLLQIPVFLGPALILSLPPVVKLIKKVSILRIPIMTFVTMSCFGLGLPATVALFPQTGKININRIEEEFRQDVKGQFSFFNKYSGGGFFGGGGIDFERVKTGITILSDSIFLWIRLSEVDIKLVFSFFSCSSPSRLEGTKEDTSRHLSISALNSFIKLLMKKFLIFSHFFV